MKHNWEYKKLGEIATFTSGSRPTGGVRGITEGVLSLGGEHIGKDGFIDLTTPKYVSYEYYEANSKGHILDGDILLCKDGALTGKVALLHDELAGKKAMVNEHVFIIRTDSLYQPYLFRYLFSDFGQYELKSRIKGAAQGGLNGSNLRTIPIPLPPLPIQQKIVAELDKVSLIIDKKKQQLKELDKLAQAIFYDMFGDPVENEKGWEVKKLDEVCDVRDGTHDSPKYIDGGEYILITSKNIVNGKIDYSNISYITKEDYDAINKRSKVDDGDIIMAMIGTIGKPIIVKMENYKFCIKNVALIKFLKDSMVSNVYIQALLNSSSFSQHIMSKNQGGTQKFVSLGTIRKLEIPLPPLALQQSFAAKIEAIEKQKELISRSIKEAQTLFDERMDYWFD